jgi:glycerophosphoryl diester phosphodiesterase
MSGLDWLIARPIAHRGLHDATAGAIENTASAFSAAIAGNYGIECDLQISADGEAMVHHDDALGRLTEGSGRLAEMSASAIAAVRFKASADHILTLRELCTLVAGRVTLVLELKSRFDGDLRLARRAADVLGSYSGPVAVMSFDPALIEAMRTISPGITRGMVAERYYAEHEWDAMPKREKCRMAFMLHFGRTRPQFVAYSLTDLPAAVPLMMRQLLGMPLLTWTVRSQDERRRAIRWANQIIFEGIRP